MNENEALSQLGILQSILTDEGHQKRLNSLMAEQGKLHQRLAEAQAKEADNRQILAEANHKLDLAEQARVAVDKERAVNLDLEKRLGEVADALTAEKRRFAEVRNKVTADQKERELDLSSRAVATTQLESDLRARAARLTAAEIEHQDRAGRTEAIIKKLRGVLADIEAM